MQQLTEAPRDGLTEAQVRSLIEQDDTVWSFGAELLDDTDNVVDDLSDDLESGSITWTGDADVHRTCRLRLARELAWGRARVLLYATADAAGITARFNLGVFVLETPEKRVGETPATYDVIGADKLTLLAQAITDTVAIAAGTNYLTKVTALIVAIDAAAVVAIDSTASSQTVPDDLAYVLTESDQPTTLRIINDLLAAIGYEPLWVDQNGRYRAGPNVTPANRPSGWTFDADDDRFTLVGEQRTLAQDLWKAYNAWLFIVRGLTFPPEEGNGQYTPPDNVSDGPTSIDAIGRRNQRTEFLDAADQDSLVAQGDAIVDCDKRVAATVTFATYPFPLAGHNDIATYVDSGMGDVRKLLATTWTFDLGSPPADTTWTWSGL